MRAPGEELLEKRISYQLLTGCDLIECNNPFCASCPNFQFKGKSKPEILKIAKDLATSNSATRCVYIPMHAVSKEMEQKLADLDAWIRAFIDSPVPNVKEAFDMIKSNISIFSWCLMPDNCKLSLLNSGINDDEMRNFTRKLCKYPELNELVNYIINTYASEITQYGIFTLGSIRKLFLVLYFPGVLANPDVLYRLLRYFCKPPPKIHHIMDNWLSSLPGLLRIIVGECQFSLNHYFGKVADAAPHHIQVLSVLESMRFIFEVNQHAVNRLPDKYFYSRQLIERVNLIDDYLRYKFDGILKYPFVFSLAKKAEICQWESSYMMRRMAHHAVVRGIRRALFRMQRPQYDLYLRLHVRRDHLLDDAIDELYNHEEADFLKKLCVEFEGESAVDVGGPSREFLYLVTERLLSPEYGMFKLVNNRSLWFVANSFEGANSFFLVGAVIGLSVYNSIVLPIRFPLCLYKKILTPDKPLSLNDLAEIDEELVRSLRQIQQMKNNGEDISDLCLNFVVSVKEFDQCTTYELINGGADIDVTNENCDLYIEEYVRFMLHRHIYDKFQAFVSGFRLTVRAASYSILTPNELDILVSGEEVLDWDALRSCTVYDGYTAESRAVMWFWEVFDEMNESEKKKFLMFSTGTDRVPYGGLASVKLIIQRVAETSQLPISHTCFNIFSLPDYETKEELANKVSLVIQYTEGFGIV